MVSDKLSADQYLRILAQSADATAVYVSKDLHIGFINEAMLILWEKSSNIVDMPLAEAAPEFLPFIPILNQVWETGVSYVAKETPANIDTDGVLIENYFDFEYRPVLDQQGKTIAIINTATNVTERMENRQIMKDKDALLAQFIEQVPAAVAIYEDADFIIRSINPAYQKLLPNRLLLGRPLMEAIPELVGTQNDEALRNTFETGNVFYREDMLIKVSDHVGGEARGRYFNVSYLPRRDGLGNIDGIFAFAVETSEKVGVRQQLVEKEENLRMAIQSADLGTWHLNTKTRRLEASLRLKELFGFNPDQEMSLNDAVGQIPETYRNVVMEAIESVIDEGGGYDLEYPVVGLQDKQTRWLRATGKLFRSVANDYESHFSGTVADITERKLDEQRRNDFIGMVSHELRSPLTSLSGYIQVLLTIVEKSNDQLASTIAKRAKRQVDKMNALIADFLDVTRLGESKIRLSLKLFDMADLMKDVKMETIATITSHSVEFLPNDLIPVQADQEKIEQVLTNLIANSVKYSPSGSRIQVFSKVENSMVRVFVKDEGMGIAPKDQIRIFDRFFRVETEQTESIKGFGIGLYLCKEIIERHGGRIGVHSELGQGSTFWFELQLMSTVPLAS